MCMLVATTSPAKTAEPIKMLFGDVDYRSRSPHGKELSLEEYLAHQKHLKAYDFRKLCKGVPYKTAEPIEMPFGG